MLSVSKEIHTIKISVILVVQPVRSGYPPPLDLSYYRSFFLWGNISGFLHSGSGRLNPLLVVRPLINHLFFGCAFSITILAKVLTRHKYSISRVSFCIEMLWFFFNGLYYITAFFIKPYRSVWPCWFFSICFFPRWPNKNILIFSYNILLSKQQI